MRAQLWCSPSNKCRTKNAQLLRCAAYSSLRRTELKEAKRSRKVSTRQRRVFAIQRPWWPRKGRARTFGVDVCVAAGPNSCFYTLQIEFIGGGRRGEAPQRFHFIVEGDEDRVQLGHLQEVMHLGLRV